ncbi:YggS family pyridoxal phosphate-dependent enzyme [Butyrivibrio sp. MC2013]|uniref:YggS family pyridoxal phosphate-dependent enzyme n=1 Tax=Butyrivibrio sp. MC2013 TaxID=1280686 RepID=UPI000423AAC0|nr:YggS family pyridoxal phosphate-dependent enzyme [Butyrivibrio sp. MC2013]
MSHISENLIQVEEKIKKACERAGRKREEVTLIAVSKTKPVSDIREAMDCGITVFGENKVQELRTKTAEITEKLSWHMIGHLQNNKVKYLPGMVDMIHSVDNMKLALEIEKQYAAKGLRADILCEVNMAGEESKFGLSPEDAIAFIDSIKDLEHIRIRGLMTIAPYTDDPESNRKYFRGLRELMNKANESLELKEAMDTLSMGMTGDYEVAIEEGASFVRVGTGIFGERNYAV